MLKARGLDKHMPTDAAGWPSSSVPDGDGSGDDGTWESLDDWAPNQFGQEWTAEHAMRAREAERDPSLVPDRTIDNPW